MICIDEKMQADLNANRVYLGGCILDWENYHYFCNNCHERFDKEPYIYSKTKNDYELLSEVTTSISFVIKNQDGYIQVMIDHKKSQYSCSHSYKTRQEKAAAITIFEERNEQKIRH